jgi:hypothetical protein
MSSTTVLINTDAGGSFSYQRPFFGLLNAVMLHVDTLDTGSLDVVISDATSDTVFHEFGELDGDRFYQPDPPFPVYGSLLIEVVNGGDTKHGSLRFMTQT